VRGSITTSRAAGEKVVAKAESRRRPTFVVKFCPAPHTPDPIRALRGLLKIARRTFGLRCIEARCE